MGQSRRHFLMCKALYEVLVAAVGRDSTVSCDLSHYFDAANPERKLAPDGAVKFGVAPEPVDSWKVWERGAPELAFEILSPSDSPERWTFEEKLARYRAMGVLELVVFDADGGTGKRLRVWDRMDGDLVERTVVDEKTPCITLDAFLVVAPVHDLPACVRVARDAAGNELVPTESEARRIAEERLSEETHARREAERKLAELEAKLRER